MKKRSGFSTGSLLLASAVGFLFTSLAGAQHLTGMTIFKTCPATAVGDSAFVCTFTVQNQDLEHGIINLSFTNTVPYPGGTTTGLFCLQAGVSVTTLGPRDSATDTCSGVAPETAPPCQSADFLLTDLIAVIGEDAGIPGLPVQGQAANAVLILACTATPTPAPPTATPTPTVTPTPTAGPPPLPTQVPPLPTQVPPHAGRPTPKPTKTPKP